MTFRSSTIFAFVTTLVTTALLTSPVIAQQGEWEPIVGSRMLNEFMSDLEAELVESAENTQRVEFRAGGSVVSAASATVGSWSIDEGDRVCFELPTGSDGSACYRLEQNTRERDRFRFRGVDENETIEFMAESRRGSLASTNPTTEGPLSNAQMMARQAESAGLGGPQSVGAALERDRTDATFRSRLPGLDRFLDPFPSFKTRLKERTGLELGMRYSATYHQASTSLTDEKDGAAGQIRFFGRWRLYERDENHFGNFVFMLEDRHQIGSGVPPTNLGGEIGSPVPTAVSYGANGTGLTVAYWQQSFADRNAGFWIGRIDPTELTDILGYANQRTTFANAALLTNLVLPGPAPAFGIGLGGMLTEKVYAIGTVSDANGDFSEIEWFPGGSEFYKYVELGWVPSRQDRYTKNVHVGFFHIDDRVDAGVEGSSGVVFGTNWLLGNDKWLPFFRAGFADEGAAVEETVTFGTLYKPGFFNDLFGLGVGWLSPASPESRDQTNIEFFYRFSVSRDIALTLTAQALINPANNPEEDLIYVFGARARIAF